MMTSLARLKNCMRRAQDGAELTIGFLGGSITQGSLATKPENCYAIDVIEQKHRRVGVPCKERSDNTLVGFLKKHVCVIVYTKVDNDNVRLIH